MDNLYDPPFGKGPQFLGQHGAVLGHVGAQEVLHRLAGPWRRGPGPRPDNGDGSTESTGLWRLNNASNCDLGLLPKEPVKRVAMTVVCHDNTLWQA